MKLLGIFGIEAQCCLIIIILAMTTVGFGDKVPRSYVGRTFAVMWVLIGIALCSLFTATLTTKVILAHAPSNPDITGKQVAVLKGQFDELFFVKTIS